MMNTLRTSFTVLGTILLPYPSCHFFAGTRLSRSVVTFAGKIRLLLASSGLFYLLAATSAIPAVQVAGTAVAFTDGSAINTDTWDAYSVFAADLDDDGDQDVLATNYFGGQVLWFENQDGLGTFSEGVEVSPCCNRTYPRQARSHRTPTAV